MGWGWSEGAAEARHRRAIGSEREAGSHGRARAPFRGVAATAQLEHDARDDGSSAYSRHDPARGFKPGEGVGSSGVRRVREAFEPAVDRLAPLRSGCRELRVRSVAIGGREVADGPERDARDRGHRATDPERPRERPVRSDRGDDGRRRDRHAARAGGADLPGRAVVAAASAVGDVGLRVRSADRPYRRNDDGCHDARQPRADAIDRAPQLVGSDLRGHACPAEQSLVSLDGLGELPQVLEAVGEIESRLRGGAPRLCDGVLRHADLPLVRLEGVESGSAVLPSDIGVLRRALRLSRLRGDLCDRRLPPVATRLGRDLAGDGQQAEDRDAHRDPRLSKTSVEHG